MKIRILGKSWQLRFVPPEEIGGKNGSCDNPCRSNKAIEIWNELKGEECLETIIHECMHAAGWDVFDEKFCETVSVDIARAVFTKEALKRILDDPKVREVMREPSVETKKSADAPSADARPIVHGKEDHEVAT